MLCVHIMYISIQVHVFIHLLFTHCRCEQYIGAGHFANVYKGEWQSLRGVKDVAVKILKNCDMASEDRVAFLQEVAIMAQFQHPNVVKLYGTVLDDAIVSRYCSISSLWWRSVLTY